jgi:NADH-ubiquinone oxidoreductase chain 4L
LPEIKKLNLGQKKMYRVYITPYVKEQTEIRNIINCIVYACSAVLHPCYTDDIYKICMSFSLILFLIGILGFVLNRKNIILMLISIEIMLLSITFLILLSSISFDDILGQTFSVYIIAIAGAESAIGLGILVAFYRLRGSISIFHN